MNLGERVKKLRKDQGWSQQDFANRTSISRARVAQLETDPTAEVKADQILEHSPTFERGPVNRPARATSG